MGSDDDDYEELLEEIANQLQNQNQLLEYRNTLLDDIGGSLNYLDYLEVQAEMLGDIRDVLEEKD